MHLLPPFLVLWRCTHQPEHLLSRAANVCVQFHLHGSIELHDRTRGFVGFQWICSIAGSSCRSEWGQFSRCKCDSGWRLFRPPVQSINHLIKRSTARTLHLCRLDSNNGLGLLQESQISAFSSDTLRAFTHLLGELEGVRVCPEALILLHHQLHCHKFLSASSLRNLGAS